MSENNVIPQPGTAETPPAAPKGGSKLGWIIAILAALVACAALLGVGAWFLLPRLFGGGDPIAGAVPAGSLVYMNVDLLKAKSENVEKIAAVFKEIAYSDYKDETSIQSADRFMKDEYGLSFTDDVMPWLGQYAGLAITDGDLKSDNTFLLIVESRDGAKADAFIEKWIAAMASKKGMQFEQHDEQGVKLYVHGQAGGTSQDVSVIARVGNFVYLSNSQEALLASAKLKNADSLAASGAYKDALAALPADRLASFYISSDAYLKFFEGLSAGSGASYAEQLKSSGLRALGAGLSARQDGLQLDMALTYDQEKLTAFQKDSLNAKYKAPTADALVPGDTFLFLDVNSDQGFGNYLQDDNPAYTKDTREALTLLEKQSGVNIQALLKLMSGELALAVGPATDGLLPENSRLDMAITVLASTSDEAGFKSWAQELLDANAKKSQINFETSDVAFGKFALQSLALPGPTSSAPMLYYGASNGYIVLGTSKTSLEKGLNGSDTLAANSTYLNTWKSFPAGGARYLYVDVQGLLAALQSSPSGASMNTAGWEKIPVVAATVNPVSNFTQSYTVIMFVAAK